MSKYRIEALLHVGNETRVLRARTQDGQVIVLKCSRSERTTAREAGRLQHEHAVLCHLGPLPGLVGLRGLEELDGMLTLVLDDPGARSLDQVLAAQRTLPLPQVLRLGLHLARTLDAVHQAGIVHKDIKPQNLLVDEALERVWLLDFGIASRLAFEATAPLIPEALEGSLSYISPEQTGRTARSLDARTDLYSLGVTLYEALAGRPPFLERDALALVHAHLAQPPPPLESLAPHVPGSVCRILERLLAKDPDARYQTAKGVAFDLECALGQWEQKGLIEPFPLGHRDFSPKLRLPNLLVGREQATQVLHAAFERAAQGAVEVQLVGGPSGIGKTALVRSVYHEIAKQGRGHLLSGKHDQLAQSIPYAALSQAIAQLMSQIAASPKPVFAAWQARIMDKVGAPSRALADLIPELEWVLGKQPDLPQVNAEMTANRLRMAWVDLVEVVRDHSPPLVLFLDDMQWADPASLEILKTLVTAPGSKRLLIIAAYRDNEAPPGHPLWKLIDEVKASGVHTSRLTVGPLDSSMVQTWLSATLCVQPERVEALAATLHRKTAGNPFFLGQLLLEQYREKRVWRDLGSGQWQWNAAAIDNAPATDNVVELMSRKVRELPETTQTLLGHAACAGHLFSLEELSALSGRSLSEVAEAVWPALQSGLLLPSDGPYREALALALARTSHTLDARYQFLHDRVQQASYERIAPAQRARTHWSVGERLRARSEAHGGSDKELLELVRHLNLGAPVLETAAQRQELARLNLRAARAAKNNSVFRLQATLAETAQALLGEAAWQEQPELSAELELERMEASFLLREFEQVHQRAQAFLLRPLPLVARLAAQELQVRTCTAAGDFGAGAQLGVEALAAQGISYPETNEGCIAAALEGLAACDAWFDEHPEGFSNLPVDPSPARLLCDAIAAGMLLCAAIGGRPGLAAVALVRNVCQVLEQQSLTVHTPFIIGSIAEVRSAFLGTYRESARWAEQSLQIAARLSSSFSPECACWAGIYLCYKQGAERSRVHYQAGLRAAAATGSFQGTGWNLFAELYFLDLWSGRPLREVGERETSQRELMAKKGVALGQHVFQLAAAWVAFLEEPLQDRPTDAQEWLRDSSRTFLAMGDGVVAEHARVQEACLFLMFEEPQRALSRAEEAETFRAALYGHPPVTDIPLWLGLAAAQCWSADLAEAEQQRLTQYLAHGLERFRYFAAGCSENFGHKLRLLEAEQARIQGRLAEALLAYDDAIEQAHAQGFLHIAALSAQLCAAFHLGQGRKRLGAQYLGQACDAYALWGAHRAVHYLRKRYFDLLPASGSLVTPEEPSSGPLAPGDMQSRTISQHRQSTTRAGGALDVGAAVRSAQALSGELHPARVVARLMQLVLESGGAQRAALLLGDLDTLHLVASLDVARPELVKTDLSVPIGECGEVSASMVELVARTRQVLLLSDARQDARFRDEVHLTRAHTRAVLATPLLQQGRLMGVLLLEHSEPDAFPGDRVALVNVLAAQAVIALENARLYEDLRTLNEGLETRIAVRTAELQKALSDLWSEMDLAAKIQTVLLPPDGMYGGYEVAGTMRPADNVGGDYYDVFEAGGCTWVLIGDVSGHGVSAGLIMMMVQTAVRSVMQSLQASCSPCPPSRVLSLVNAAVVSNLSRIDKGQYMTLTALCLRGDSVQFAGLHLDLLVHRAATHTIEQIETEGVWLGVVEDVSELMSDRWLTLQPGDTLLLWTDGLPEARLSNGALVGTQAIATWLGQHAGAASCRRVVDAMLSQLEGACTPDDVTLLVLRRPQAAHP